METLYYICNCVSDLVMRFFETLFLDEVSNLFSTLDFKTIRKILYNIDLAEQTNDPRLFKKLNSDIWEFRTKYNGNQYRLLAFWDKTSEIKTLVIATHGFIKKLIKYPIKKSIKQ